MKVFFVDLDGTLEDSRADMIDCVNKSRVHFDLAELEPELITPFLSKGMNHIYLNCFKELFENSKNEENTLNNIKVFFEEIYTQNVCIKTACYPNIKEMLSELNKIGDLFLVTNKPEMISRKLIQELKLANFFKDVIGGDTTTETKPSVLPLFVACQKHGLTKFLDEFYVIGDGIADITMGNKFGAKTIWCSWGYTKELPNDCTPHFSAINPDQVVQYCNN